MCFHWVQVDKSHISATEDTLPPTFCVDLRERWQHAIRSGKEDATPTSTEKARTAPTWPSFLQPQRVYSVFGSSERFGQGGGHCTIANQGSGWAAKRAAVSLPATFTKDLK